MNEETIYQLFGVPKCLINNMDNNKSSLNDQYNTFLNMFVSQCNISVYFAENNDLTAHPNTPPVKKFHLFLGGQETRGDEQRKHLLSIHVIGGLTVPKVARETIRMHVRTDLRRQLKKNKMTSAYWYDLIEDYMKFWDIKEDLQKSIRKQGVILKVQNGPQVFYKRNDAVAELPKISKRMTDILDKLNIVSNIEDDDSGDDDV